jgi:hypothetical protein
MISISESDDTDITPEIEWSTPLSATDLLAFIDEPADAAALWREIALAALDHLHRVLAQHDQLRTALREVVAEIEARERELAS